MYVYEIETCSNEKRDVIYSETSMALGSTLMKKDGSKWIVVKEISSKAMETPIAQITWTVADIWKALIERGVSPTKEAIEGVREILDTRTYEEHCIQYGWEYMMDPAVEEYVSKIS